ncbi:hypothetical protein GCM10029964_018900 [Kibdelosporangium lantanae]
MISSRRSPATTGDFNKARLDAAEAEGVQRDRAARTVTSHAIDDTDCEELLTMLGLSPVPPAPVAPSLSPLG